MKLIHKFKKDLFTLGKTGFLFLLVLLPLIVGGWISCGKPGANAPVGPSLGMNLSVNLQASSSAKAKLLGAATNEVYYSVTGPAMSPVTGVAGPFTTSADTGTVSLSLLVPQGSARLMAFQMNDASNHSPLAIGAVQTDIGGSGVNQTVEMGSLIRNCYNERSAYFSDGCYFSFQSENLADAATVGGPAGYDIDFLPNGATFQLSALNSDTLIYMGNNNLVNDAMAPSTGYVANSTLAKQAAGAAVTDPVAGDVFCINLGSGNGFAWLYVVNMGLGPGTSGPNFEFRLNNTLNYYGYQQTTGDLAGPCATPVPTPTPCPLC
ncbi:MAG TPA: hypothetical protein VK791_04045 [bacterium]|jgi:hypothetical protein|nr:hypothetical protein [bacterium]